MTKLPLGTVCLNQIDNNLTSSITTVDGVETAPGILWLRWSVVLVGMAFTFGLSACTVGPDFKSPTIPDTHAYAPASLPASTVAVDDVDGAAQTFHTSLTISQDWWSVFHSDKLDRLIELGLGNSPNIQAAQAVLKQAQEAVYAQQGYFYPTAALNYSLSRQYIAGNMGGNAPGLQGNGQVIGPEQAFTFHTAQLTVGYTPDVFGANSRQVEALQAAADTQVDQLQAARLTLVSNLVAAAMQEASLRAQMNAVQTMIDDNQRALEIVQQQMNLGYAMRMDVAGQEAALAIAQQQLPSLQKSLEQTRDLIRMLVGNPPDHDVAATFSMADFSLPTDLPLSLPAQLIRQRPDVRAAEAQLHVASANVGVAVAARLPQFSIVGAYGGEATVFNQMFQQGGPFWDLVGNVMQPIFDGNTLLHRKRAADQALVQAAAQYRSTVLVALQNVADTLHALHADAASLAAADRAEHAAKVSLDITQKQNQEGYVPTLSVLNAEQTHLQAMLGVIQARSQRLGDTAALYEALGGGWWNTGHNVANHLEN